MGFGWKDLVFPVASANKLIPGVNQGLDYVGGGIKKAGESAWGGVKKAAGAASGALDRDDQGFGDKLSGQAGSAGQFADKRQGHFNSLGKEAGAERGYLRDTARGQNSVSAEQLRQGLQQNMAAQQSMAAGARPGNSMMAARNAALQSARLGSGLAGQQAMAGIQERNQAQQALAQMLMQQRQQELQASLGARGQSIQGYGAGMNAALGTPSTLEQFAGIAGPAASLIAMSDERLKTGISKGDGDADEFLKGLKAYRFSYKDEKHGKGEQLGIMAQELEKSGLGRQAVIDTPEGKAVHGGKLATALAATLPGIDKRLAKLEGKGRKGD